MVSTDHGFEPQKGLVHRLKNLDCFNDKAYREEYAKSDKHNEELCDDTLITPLTPFGSRVLFRVLEFEELVDSSCVNLESQIQMAEVIEKNYEDYDGFVLCHGTDTMAYTGATLSFMLENLSKTVVLTGSQIPMS